MWIFKCEKWIIFGLFSPIWHNIQRCWGVGKTKGHMKKLPWFLWNRHCPFSPFGIILWTTPLTNGSRNWPTNALQPFDFYVSWKLETDFKNSFSQCVVWQVPCCMVSVRKISERLFTDLKRFHTTSSLHVHSIHCVLSAVPDGIRSLTHNIASECVFGRPQFGGRPGRLWSGRLCRESCSCSKVLFVMLHDIGLIIGRTVSCFSLNWIHRAWLILVETLWACSRSKAKLIQWDCEKTKKWEATIWLWTAVAKLWARRAVRSLFVCNFFAISIKL